VLNNGGLNIVHNFGTSGGLLASTLCEPEIKASVQM